MSKEQTDDNETVASKAMPSSTGLMSDTEILDWLCWHGHLIGIKTENFITYYDENGNKTNNSRYTDLRKWVNSFQSNK